MIQRKLTWFQIFWHQIYTKYTPFVKTLNPVMKTSMKLNLPSRKVVYTWWHIYIPIHGLLCRNHLQSWKSQIVVFSELLSFS